MRSFRLLLMAALISGLSSCNTAVVRLSFSPVSPTSPNIVVKCFDGPIVKTIDTVKLNSDGCVRCRIPVCKGEPEFVYLYKDEVKLASLLLSAGDKVDVCCDTNGFWTVSGSKDCELLRDNEMERSSFLAAKSFTVEEYLAFYRKMLNFVMVNSHSLASIPVLYFKISDTPLFFHNSDAVIFSSLADSLEVAYPKSKYVKTLRADADKKLKEMQLRNMLENAQVAQFPELKLPDINGNEISLSAIHKGKTLLVFWDCADAASKIFNLEVLEPYFQKNADDNFNIYQVNVGQDKNSWALVVREQNMPWYNVCDIYGTSASSYGVEILPAFFMLENGEINKYSYICQ